MSLKTTNRQIIDDVPWGVYVWQLPDGGYVTDDEGNFMLVHTTKGNRESIKAITDAARHYGITEGKPVFWSGRRPINDEEYEHQLARMRIGLVPDPLDIQAIKEEEAALRAENQG